MPVLNDADDLRLGTGQVDKVYLGANLVWEPAGPASTVTADAIRIPDSNEFVPWPTGTVENDLVIIQYESGWNVVVPTDWHSHYRLQGSNGSGMLVSKVMSAADITAGGVTLTTTGGSIAGHCNIVRAPGYGTNTLSLENSSQSGLLTIGAAPSNVEQVVTGCDLDLSSVGSHVVLDYNFWWSMSEAGSGKTVTWRIRRDNLSGTIVASGSNGATIDSVAGHNINVVGQAVDFAPTTGRYVLTVQCTGGFTSAIYSDSRFFKAWTKRPVIRSFAGVYTGTGFTSTSVTSGTAEVGDTALYMVGHRVSSVTQNCDIGTLVDSQAGVGASGGIWQESIAAAGTRTATFTSATAGTNRLPQIALIAWSTV